MSDTQFDDEILDSNAISPTDEEGNPVPVTIPIALAPGVTVVYTTRLGGVSHGDFGDCNLGGKGGDDPQAILANRVSLAKSVGCGLSLVSQVHSGRAVDVDASWHLNTPFGFDVSGTPCEVTADGEAQAIRAVQQALADSLAMLNEKAPNDQVLKLKALEAMQKVADGKATKIIIPSELQGLAGLATGITEAVKEAK